MHHSRFGVAGETELCSIAAVSTGWLKGLYTYSIVTFRRLRSSPFHPRVIFHTLPLFLSALKTLSDDNLPMRFVALLSIIR